MAVKKYVIVDEDYLNESINDIADAIKEVLGESGGYNFPEDFISNIRRLYYDNNPNTSADIIVGEDGKITVNHGMFVDDAIKQLATVAGGTIVPSPSEQVVAAKGSYTLDAIKVGPIPSSYKDMNTVETITELDLVDKIIPGESITVPAGYYPNAITINAPSAPDEGGEE